MPSTVQKEINPICHNYKSTQKTSIKEIKNIYSGNYKMLIKVIEEEMHKQKDVGDELEN